MSQPAPGGQPKSRLDRAVLLALRDLLLPGEHRIPIPQLEVIQLLSGDLPYSKAEVTASLKRLDRNGYIRFNRGSIWIF